MANMRVNKSADWLATAVEMDDVEDAEFNTASGAWRPSVDCVTRPAVSTPYYSITVSRHTR